MYDMNELAKEIHENAINKGFWEDDPPNIDRKILLAIGELVEAQEAIRENRMEADWKSMCSASFENFDDIFKRNIKDTFGDELADTIIRCLDLAYYLKIDINRHVFTKVEYNRNRQWKHGKGF